MNDMDKTTENLSCRSCIVGVGFRPEHVQSIFRAS